MKSTRILAGAVLAVGALLAQTARQEQDAEYARLVKEWTTRPEFMSPLVDHLPKVAGVPTPKDVLGYYIGAPKKLTTDRGLGPVLSGACGGVEAREDLPAGRTDEGRECVVVAVADEETIRNLDTYKATWRSLADPRGLSGESAADHRPGQADLHVHRRPAQLRDGAAGNADGTGLPAGGGGNAAVRSDPQQRDRHDERWRSRTAATATSTGITATR